jgi:hypothetical protein
MKFQPGQSGNPTGRPKGSGRMAKYRAMLDPAVPDIFKVVVEKAKAGDLTAAKLILDRVYPVRDAATAVMTGGSSRRDPELISALPIRQRLCRLGRLIGFTTTSPASWPHNYRPGPRTA